MLTRRQWIVVLGTAVSLLLLVGVFVRLDWPSFWSAMQKVSLTWITVAGAITVGGTLLRALRWTLIAGVPIDHFRYYCRATNFGYLANALLPARAGEAVRMLSVVRSTNATMPKAMTSAVIDRFVDLGMLGLVTLMVAANHGTKMLGQQAVLGISGLLGGSVLCVLLFLLNRDRFTRLVFSISARLPVIIGSRLPSWYMEAYDGLRPLRNQWRMISVILLSLAVILSDYASMWFVIIAFWLAATILGGPNRGRIYHRRFVVAIRAGVWPMFNKRATMTFTRGRIGGVWR